MCTAEERQVFIVSDKVYAHKNENIEDMCLNIKQAQGLLGIFYKYAYSPAINNTSAVDAAARLREFGSLLEALYVVMADVEGLADHLAADHLAKVERVKCHANAMRTTGCTA